MKPHIMMIAMGVPSIVSFEVEVVELNLEYERKQASRGLKNLDDCLGVGIQKWRNYLPYDCQMREWPLLILIETHLTICTCPNLLNF
jgi:hypothetical protein